MAEAADDMEAQFREFVTTRSTALLRTAYLLAGDWTTAEDLLQVSLTKTYLAWQRLGRIDAVEPYTRRVLVNTATSWWRRRWHRERPTEIVPEISTPDTADQQVERDALWQQVKSLPPRQRAVLVLRFYEDMSEIETARLLGVTVGTVKSQSSRALATLRGRLAAEDQVAGAAGDQRTAGDRPLVCDRPSPQHESATAGDEPVTTVPGRRTPASTVPEQGRPVTTAAQGCGGGASDA